MSVSVRAEIKGDFNPTAQLEEIKARVLRNDVPRAFEIAKRQGLPARTEKGAWTLLVRNRGRQNRRDFGTLRPKFLRIPFELQWVGEGGDVRAVREAAEFALFELRKRAPVVTGDYRNSFEMRFNGRRVNATALGRADISAGQSVFVMPNIAYAAIIEAGFYKRYYRTRSIPGGIVRPVARKVRRKFGDRVSARFIYMQGFNSSGGRGGTLPVIEISTSGAFGQNDSVPGRRPRRRRR